jgi:hypothetical protein
MICSGPTAVGGRWRRRGCDGADVGVCSAPLWFGHRREGWNCGSVRAIGSEGGMLLGILGKSRCNYPHLRMDEELYRGSWLLTRMSMFMNTYIHE